MGLYDLSNIMVSNFLTFSYTLHHCFPVMKYHVTFKFSDVFLILKHKASVYHPALLCYDHLPLYYPSIIPLLSVYMSDSNDQFWFPATGAASGFKMVL